MKRKILASLLAVVMSVSLLPMAAFADEDTSITKVAKIGETEYATVDDAWDAAIDAGNATIEMLADASIAATYSIRFSDVNIILELNQRTITVSHTEPDYTFGINRSTLTIQNGTMDTTNAILTGSGKQTITLTNVTFKGKINPFGGTVVFKSGKVQFTRDYTG